MPFVARPVPFVASCRPGPPARRHPAAGPAPKQRARWTLPKILLWAGIALHLPERRADSTG